METRIDPPSSMYRLDLAGVKKRHSDREVFVIGEHPDACMFVEPKGDALYLGKVAIEPTLRGTGRFAALIAKAENVAAAANLTHLEIESRIKLTEVHAAFSRQGFTEIERGAHEGYQTPTFIVMRKQLH